jgi:O-antigen ligase
MTKVTNAALFFLAAGIFTSVTILSAYQVLFVIPVAYYSYLAIKEKKLNLPVSAWFLLAFSAVAVLSLVVNIDLVPKPSKNFGRVKYFLFGVGGIFVLRVWLKDATDRAKRILVNTFLLSIVVAGSVAIHEYITGEDNRAKGLTDTMRYGYGTAMALLVLLSATLHQDKLKRWFDWRLAVPVFIIGFTGMYLTYTRGALLGFLCGLPFLFYFYKPKLGMTFAVIAAMTGMFLGYFYLNGTGTQFKGNRFLMSRNNSGDVIRRSQWQAAVIAIKEKPILGYGLSNFHTQVKRIKIEHDLEKKDYDDAHAHNIFLETFAGTGIIGLVLLIGWILFWAIESFKSTPLIRALVVPFGVALVVSSQFEVTFDANNASMIFFLYALSSASKENV